jgi:hypothetical protein
MPRHKQVEIRWGDGRAEVDEKLAPLILALWKAGINTSYSCQGNMGMAYIQFPTAWDAQKFLNLVAVYPAEDVPFAKTLYGRIVGCWSRHNWQYDLRPNNESVFVDDKGNAFVADPADFEFRVGVRFPPKDIPVVLEQIRQRRARRGR